MFRNKEKQLNKKIFDLKVELEDLKIRKEMRERDIMHLVKIKEEKMEIEFEKREVELQKRFAEKEIGLTNDFHKKYLSLIEDSKKELNAIHEKIVERLPKWETKRTIKE